MLGKNSLEKDNGDDDYVPPNRVEKNRKVLEGESNQFALLSKSIGVAHILFFWLTVGFFVLLILGVIVGAVRVLLDKPIDREFYGILAAFLAGSLGAGFGDKIFSGLRRYWDGWADVERDKG